LAKNAEAGFMDKFVRQDGLGLYDVVSKSGPDTSIRPNQIFAVSLPHSPIPKDVQKQVVDVVAERLLTPAGLRSLAPDDPAYKPIYQGGPAERDGSYHQGTVWPWLLGPFVEAHLRVYNDATAAKNLVSPMLQRMALQGIGQLSEIADGDLPHSPNGCIAQAWSVAETLRICKLLGEMAA
jgi:glycogen debranching enzyme